MADTQETGAPASADTAPATAVAATNGSTTAVPENDWTAALPEDTRATVSAKGWKSPADAVKSYTDLMRDYTETKTKALVPPGPDAKPEDYDAFYAKLGRPEKPEAYEFKLPDGLPESMPYDAKSAEKYKSWAHKSGLSPQQAQTLHDEFVRDQASQLESIQRQNTEAAKSAHETLTKEWGDPSSDTYKRNQELANRAIRQAGGSELLKEMQRVGALGPNGEVLTPHLAKAFAKFGSENYAEDTLYGGPSQGPNPFSDKSVDMTKQGQIIRNDPDHARALIRAAGHEPQRWGL